MMTARRLKNWFVVLVIAVVGIATNKLMLSLVAVLLLRIALTLTDINGSLRELNRDTADEQTDN